MAGKVSEMLSNLVKALSGKQVESDAAEAKQEKNKTAMDLKEIALEAMRMKADAEAAEKSRQESQDRRAAKAGK